MLPGEVGGQGTTQVPLRALRIQSDLESLVTEQQRLNF